MRLSYGRRGGTLSPRGGGFSPPPSCGAEAATQSMPLSSQCPGLLIMIAATHYFLHRIHPEHSVPCWAG